MENNLAAERNRIIEQVRRKMNATDSAGDEEVKSLIEAVIFQDEYVKSLSVKDKKLLIDLVFQGIRRELDILHPYAEDDQISEIMVNGNQNIFIEKNGKMQKVNLKFDTQEQLEELIRRLASKVHRQVNELNPIVDARLEDGSRVSAVYSNIALNGPILTIRRFPKIQIQMDDLIKGNTITDEAADFLEKRVKAKCNIFISGGTSSGKTTFLNVLSNYIPVQERVIVIEDSAELQIENIPNLVRLQTKNADIHGKGQVTIRDLIKVALRMRPDRIIVGEVRGEEALDMLQAMNTGHEGSLSTGHANTAQGMLYRLETMILAAENFPLEAIRMQIVSAIDLMIHLGRMEDMSRKVLEISEITGINNGTIQLNPLFVFDSKDLHATGNQLKRIRKGVGI